MSRKEAEQLIERGSWVEHFNLYRMRHPDGTISDNVYIDPKLNDGKVYRLWVFFFHNAKSAQLSWEQQQISDWRRRRG